MSAEHGAYTNLMVASKLESLGPGLPAIEISKLKNSSHHLTKEEIQLIRQQLAHAFSYVNDVIGTDEMFSKHFSIHITRGRGGLGAADCIIRIPESYLERVFESDADWLEMQTGLVHEVVHDISVDEALPMFIEFIHYIETRNIDRLSSICSLYTHPNFAQCYIDGMNQISRWLECEPLALFETLLSRPLPELKHVFKKQLFDFIENDPD